MSTQTIIVYAVFIVLFGGIIYFFNIRPRKKQEEQRKKVMTELKKGDEVMTVGGIFAVIESIQPDNFILRLESGATMKVVKGAVAGRVKDVFPNGPPR